MNKVVTFQECSLVQHGAVQYCTVQYSTVQCSVAQYNTVWYWAQYHGLDMQVHDELVQRIFPGMALMSPEPYCTAELWSLLELLPYRIRFEVYDAAQVSTVVCSLLKLHWSLVLLTSVPHQLCCLLGWASGCFV